MASPTVRTLRWLRKLGWSACVVEKYNHFARVRQDAFQFGDILAFKTPDRAAIAAGMAVLAQSATEPHERKFKPLGHGAASEGFLERNPPLPAGGIALVQCTSYTNLSTRVRKMCSNPHLEGWLAAGGHAIAIGWKPRKREPSVRVL